MNFPRTRSLFGAMVFVVVLLPGCATTQPIPEISDPQSAAIAIDVVLFAPIGLLSSIPDQIYFAKTDSGDSLLQQQIIRSNFVRDGRAYLLNARPGTYVAIAVFFSRAGVPAGAPSTGVTVAIGRSGYTTYFSKELVEHTRMAVAESAFVFMGSYVVDQSTGLDGADEVQAHYKNVIAPGEATGVLAMAFGGAVHYRGALRERKVDEQARSEFFKMAKEDLAGSRWAARIK